MDMTHGTMLQCHEAAPFVCLFGWVAIQGTKGHPSASLAFWVAVRPSSHPSTRPVDATTPGVPCSLYLLCWTDDRRGKTSAGSGVSAPFFTNSSNFDILRQHRQHLINLVLKNPYEKTHNTAALHPPLAIPKNTQK